MAVDGRYYDQLARPLVVAGRHPRPDRALEVAIDESLAARRHLGPGDTFDVQIGSGEAPGPAEAPGPDVADQPRLTLEVTGVERQPYDLSASTGSPLLANSDNVYLTPAFWQRYRDQLTAPRGLGLAVRVRGGTAGVGPFAEAVAAAAGEEAVVRPGAEDLQALPAVRRAIDLQARSLLAFAGLAVLASVLIVGQALSRRVAQGAGPYPVLNALGMTGPQLVGTTVVASAPMALAGAVLAVGIAVAASPLAPIGVARQAELDPGFRLDVGVLAPGAAVLALGVLCWVGSSAWLQERRRQRAARTMALESVLRTSPVVDRLAGKDVPLPLGVGLRMALDRGQGASRIPLSSAVASVALGLAAVVAALAFGASLDRVVEKPALQGWNWDVVVGEASDATAAAEDADVLADSPAVASFSGISFGPITVDGDEVSFAGMATDHGLVSSPVLRGSQPVEPDEIAVGSGTLERLGKRIGDGVELALGGSPPVPARIVGTVLPPAVLDDSMTLTSGGVMTLAGVQRVVGDSIEVVPGSFLVRYAPGVDPGQALAGLRADFGDTVLLPTSTADVENMRRVQGLPYLLAGLVSLLGLATLAHAMATAVHRRRRDLAVLKALGFVRRQLRATVAWQATMLAVVAAVAGAPLGILAGRWAWALVVERLGGSAGAVVPLSAAAAIAAVVILANLIAAGPARAAARIRPAEALRSE